MTPALTGRSGQFVLDDPDPTFHVEHVSSHSHEPWNGDDVANLSAYRAQGLTGEAIAELLGRSHAAVRKKVHKLGWGVAYTKPMKWRK